MHRALAARPPSSAPVWLLAAGKASAGMAGAAVAHLGTRMRGGLVAAPEAVDLPPSLECVVAEHPAPGRGSEEAGRRALQLAAAVPADAELLVLVSGGASSLLTAPAPGLSLGDKRATTAVLLRSGADIYALNTVRKHLSAIKGGRLAAGCRGVCRAFVLSDVVGDDLSVIASGPTVPDQSTFGDAWQVVQAYGGTDAYPAAVIAHLAAGVRGQVPESPKPGDARLARTDTLLVGGRRDAMRGAADEARRLGYEVVILDPAVVGEARHAGESHSRAVLARASTLRRPACIISSGETTVRVRGRGRGGRNQEFALAAGIPLEAAGLDVVLASVGTDGVDGPTDAAGAVADSTTLARARARGLDSPGVYLDANDSYVFFDALGDLVRTGPTGTNVGDLQVFLLA